MQLLKIISRRYQTTKAADHRPREELKEEIVFERPLVELDKIGGNTKLASPWGSAGAESTCNAGGLGSSPGLGRAPGEGNG